MGLDRARKVSLRRAASALRGWRETARLSITQAADRLAVAPQVWAAWEAGRKRPTLANALALEDLANGAVRFELWDYPPALVTTLRAAVARRKDESAAVATSAFAGEG